MRSSFIATRCRPRRSKRRDHLADEVALDAVGLDEDEGAFEAHGAQV